MPDIDIDFADRDVILSKIEHRVAKLDTGKKHNTGVYVTEAPHNPVDNLCTIDHKTADQRGYFKLDFLNVSIYKDVKNEAHLQELMEREPIWATTGTQRLRRQSISSKRARQSIKTIEAYFGTAIGGYTSNNTSGQETLSRQSWNEILNEVWVKPTNGEYYFKKAHAFSYAMAVVVHINLLCEQLNKSKD